MFLCWSSPLSSWQMTRAFSRRETLPVLYCRRKSIEVHYNDTAENVQQETLLGGGVTRLPDLSFNRLQIGDQVLSSAQKWAFGRFAAHEAALNEEYWAAAWLRAEAHYEALTYMRHVDSFKRKYSEKEFYALKRRCAGRDGNSLKCSCIVAVKKEDPNVKRTVLNSVVGTLDLSIRLFVKGDVFLGESSRSSTTLVQHKACNTDIYAYIANVCVSKFARRQGIATNMLFLATDIAASSGLKHLFVHVNADNRPAQELYRKIGFEMVERDPAASEERLLLMLKKL